MGLFTPKTATQRLFSKIPTLETPRLLLRRIRPEDAKDMYDYAKRPEVTKYLTWFCHDSPAYTEEYLRYLQKSYKQGTFYDWGLELKESGRFIGTCGFTCIDEDHNFAEVGYVLHPEYHGQGLMTEALKEVIRFGFEVLCVERIEAKHMEGNERSAAVMKRCGMQYEGLLRRRMIIKNNYESIHLYSILKQEFDKT